MICRVTEFKLVCIGEAAWLAVLVLLFLPKSEGLRRYLLYKVGDDELDRKRRNVVLAISLGAMALVVAGLAGYAISPGFSSGSDTLVWVLCSCLLLFLSVWRFMETRLKRTRLTCEFYIVLSKSPTAPTTERAAGKP